MASVSEKYRALVELAPDPIFLIDPSTGTIVEVNDAASSLLGYDRSSLEGMPVTDLHPADQTDAYRSLFEQTFDDNELRATALPDGNQLYLVTRTDGRIPVELHARKIDVAGDSLIYTIARDITRRYEHEQELERQKNRFEKFAKVVSHDLRNPLNIAGGRVELAAEECDSEHLDEAAQALDRMEMLIDDLLQLAQTGDLAPEWIDLASFAQTCWQNVETDDAEISIEVAQEIYADQNRVQQLFENLMRNVVEHGGSDVTIIVGGLPDGFYIEDTGPGIPADEREQIFDPGYSTSEDGTGFGLDIVKQVVIEHEWDIGVTDGSTGGARFAITNVETK